jgi:hypothetical protein
MIYYNKKGDFVNIHMDENEEIKRFLQDVMDKTYPLCKYEDNAVAVISAQLNSKAYSLLKQIERRKEQHSDS